MPIFDAIEARSVKRRFGHRYALRGVSQRFLPGSITVVQGANGAGKSTLLSILATLLSPTSGAVLYPPFSDVRRVRAALGWVGHQSLCYPALSGQENVQFAARLYGVPKEAWRSRWESVVARVGAEEFAKRPVSVLSRGQRQRIALARALVHCPGALLLDEPASGLDQRSREQLVQILKEEKARGGVVILATHSQQLTDAVADRCVVIQQGKLG